MADTQNILSAIEDAIVDTLDSQQLFQVRDVDIDKIKQGLVHPAVFVSTESGAFTRVTGHTYRCKAGIFLVAVMKDFKDERARRRGIYPILMGIILLLAGKRLSLEITPIAPVRFRNVTHEALRKLGLTAYEIELSTSFDVTVADEDDTTAFDMLHLGVSYYLQDPADDGNPDAEDQIF